MLFTLEERYGRVRAATGERCGRLRSNGHAAYYDKVGFLHSLRGHFSPDRERVGIVAVLARDAVAVHLALEKRAVHVDFVPDLPIRVVERLSQKRRSKPVEKYLSAGIVLVKLRALDEVAYVRFASVYREFKDVNDFVSELKSLLSER